MWQRITDAETSQRCWSAIEEIEGALRQPQAPGSPLFANGTAGLAVFFAYLDAARRTTSLPEQRYLASRASRLSGEGEEHAPRP